ncbi:hypothetical protein BDV96DRAFT_648693 [Lophiotrema nucula]|uniref:Rhodopsin domain-containing protein n=1 Tax=Lophiotrema nucula TaxID=690887 RepID=A0A6A5Z113_9PLEO|nr:hypothetical protein BDV96DRAFT_648693 [Lophiotrema nucula]
MIHPSAEEIAYMEAHVDDDRRLWFVGINAACLAVGYLAVTLRFLSRSKIGTNLGLDDWLIGLALLFLTGHTGCLFVAVRFGMGRHAILVNDLKSLAVVTLVAQTFYNLCISTIKLSILSLYGRIFNRTTGWFTPTLHISALFVVLYTIPQCVTYVFRCVPVESLWTDYGPGFKVYCINFQAVIVSFGIINIVTDWYILALPLPVVVGLKLERRTKWSICSLFMIGGLVCVISIIRLIYARRVETADPSWDFAPIAMISSLEGSSGILAACMPTWRPLFKFLRQGITSYFSSKNRSRSTSCNEMGVGFGNTTTVRKSRARSRSRVRSAGPGIQGSSLGVVLGGKRSETSTSGSSVENMLKLAEIEMSDRDSKSLTSGSPRELSRSNSETNPGRSTSPASSNKGVRQTRREEHW